MVAEPVPCSLNRTRKKLSTFWEEWNVTTTIQNLKNFAAGFEHTRLFCAPCGWSIFIFLIIPKKKETWVERGKIALLSLQRVLFSYLEFFSRAIVCFMERTVLRIVLTKITIFNSTEGSTDLFISTSIVECCAERQYIWNCSFWWHKCLKKMGFLLFGSTLLEQKRKTRWDGC